MAKKFSIECWINELKDSRFLKDPDNYGTFDIKLDFVPNIGEKISFWHSNIIDKKDYDLGRPNWLYFEITGKEIMMFAYNETVIRLWLKDLN